MRRAAVLGLLLAAGCSNAPIADLLDWCKPGRLPAEYGPPYGGVGPPGPVIGVTEVPVEPPPAGPVPPQLYPPGALPPPPMIHP